MTDQCPACKADLTGEPIPDKDKEHYEKGSAHFSRIIGMVENDRIHHWRCPDCGHEEKSRAAFAPVKWI